MSRILHIVESLDRGAVENWLIRTFREAKAADPATDWTFYCVLTRDGAHDQETRSMGAQVLHSPVEWHRTTQFIRSLREEIRRGQYDVLHCHHDFMSALYLAAAMGIRLKRRIVHVHNTDEGLPTNSKIKRGLLLEPFRRICLHLSDRVVGISHDTLEKFLNGRSPRPGRDLVRYYNIDEPAFNSVNADRKGFIEELGVMENQKLLLCLGRMVALKNPVQSVDVMCEIMKVREDVVGVFAGDGELLNEAKSRADSNGMGQRFRFLGWRPDTIRIMKCCDLLVFTRLESPKEGLGLVVVEAQAAGLPVLTTYGISDDAIFTDRVVRLPLAAPMSLWVKHALELLEAPRPTSAECQSQLATSHFSLDQSVRQIVELYK